MEIPPQRSILGVWEPKESFLSRKVGQEDESTKEQVQLPLVVMLLCLSFPSCTGGNTAFARCLGYEEEKRTHSLGSYFKNKPKAPYREDKLIVD